MTTRELRDDLRDAISNLRASRDKYRHRPDWATRASRQRAQVLRGVILDLWPRRQRNGNLREWLAYNADGLLAAAEELDACRRDLAEERARTTRLTEALEGLVSPRCLQSRDTMREAIRQLLAKCGAGTEQPA